ncbi:MAG: TRAP transporter small permease subunit [Clostridiales bacterium]|nr:TRAP transporter small permease subunit [Clostridiales bacterium]
MMKVLKTADRILAVVLKTIVIILTLGVAGIMMTRVVIRIPFLFTSMSWAEEIISAMMAWMVMTGATILFREGEHFRVEIMDKKYGDKVWMRIINLVISVMNFTFIALLLYYSFVYLRIRPQTSPILQINVHYFYASVPVNAGLSLLYLTRDVIVCAIRLKNPGFAKTKPELPQADTAGAVGQE